MSSIRPAGGRLRRATEWREAFDLRVLRAASGRRLLQDASNERNVILEARGMTTRTFAPLATLLITQRLGLSPS